jgi:hypothetical protein
MSTTPLGFCENDIQGESSRRRNPRPFQTGNRSIVRRKEAQTFHGAVVNADPSLRLSAAEGSKKRRPRTGRRATKRKSSGVRQVLHPLSTNGKIQHGGHRSQVTKDSVTRRRKKTIPAVPEDVHCMPVNRGPTRVARKGELLDEG